jgi:hypothetical protein
VDASLPEERRSVGEALNVARVPVIKKQAISAYDPRVVEVTGISMMVTAQGADHTTGNAPSFKCDDKTVEELAAESLKMQINSAVADSLGICVFGRTVTDVNLAADIQRINDAFDIGVTPDFIRTHRHGDTEAGARVQPACRLYGERRRAAFILCNRAAAANGQESPPERVQRSISTCRR